ncbi:MAG: hypothetical protein ACKOET_13055 [Verrucomicrobiota bacterium]
MKTIHHPAAAGAAALLVLFAGSPAEAAPVRYRYDDTQHHSPGGWGPLGVGEFTLEVGTELGDYVASEVQGGPGSRAGWWTSVIFSAHPGEPAWLYVHHSYHPLEYSNPFQIGLGFDPEHLVDPNSSADVEWARILARFSPGNASGRFLTPVSSPSPVPEAVSRGWATALGLGLTALYGRRRGQAHREREPDGPGHSARPSPGDPTPIPGGTPLDGRAAGEPTGRESPG